MNFIVEVEPLFYRGTRRTFGIVGEGLAANSRLTYLGSSAFTPTIMAEIGLQKLNCIMHHAPCTIHSSSSHHQSDKIARATTVYRLYRVRPLFLQLKAW